MPRRIAHSADARVLRHLHHGGVPVEEARRLYVVCILALSPSGCFFSSFSFSLVFDIYLSLTPSLYLALCLISLSFLPVFTHADASFLFLQ